MAVEDGDGPLVGSLAVVQRQKLLLQSLSQQEKTVLEELCEFNDVSDETLRLNAETIHRIEMFMFNFPRIRCLQLFPALKSLALMQQTFHSIEGLESCVHLESLWLCENKIERIDGLGKCLRLRELFLHSNQIERIENLAHLTALESLWLANNKIERIEGLEDLTRLRNLNLARNPISSVGGVFSINKELETLNLADTKVGSFKEIAHLARLPKLRELYLSDPHWGQSPVSQLCNYQTYALFAMGGLRVLDALELSDDAKGAAEATYMKKRMYYNMKIKTLQRKTSNGVKLAAEGKAAQVGQAQAVLAALTRLQKDVEQEMETAPSDKAPDSPRFKKHQAATSAVNILVAKVDDIERTFERCKKEAYELSDVAVRRLRLELETGGNTRLEDGKPSDLWFSSCSDLVTSRFFPADYSRYGITGVRVTGVTRVHNRSLRNRFEATLEEKVDTSDPNYKRALEYLFTGNEFSNPEHLQLIAEDGFDTEAVTLTNSLGLADLPRLQACTRADVSDGRGDVRGSADNLKMKQGLQRALAGLTGRLLVSKVFLGKTQAAGEEGGLGGNPKGNQVNGKVQSGAVSNTALRPSSGAPRSVNLERFKDRLSNGLVSGLDYPGADSVYVPDPSDEKQCTWAVFDTALVLPEYVVEFEYTVDRGMGVLGQAVVKAGRPFVSDREAAKIAAIHSDGLDRVDPDVRAICRPLAHFLADVRSPRGSRALARNGESCTDGAYLTVLNMAPLLTSRARTLVLTEDALTKQCNVAAPWAVTWLNLHNNSIRKIEALSAFVNLRVLVLSFNSIQKLEGLDGLTQLEKLDVSYNYVKRIDGLKGLHALRTLDLASNQIYKLDDVSTLKRSVPSLTSLSLRNNPVTDSWGYQETVLRKLKHLTALDGKPITGHSVHSPKALLCVTSGTIREALAGRQQPRTSSAPGRGVDLPGETYGGERRSSEDWPREGRLHGGFGGFVGSGAERLTEADAAGPAAGARDGGFGEVLELALEHRRLRGLQGLESLTQLRRLSLRDNELADVDVLTSLVLLEDLNLEENRIVRIDGLENLTGLRKLELGKNRVASCEKLRTLTGLSQLSIEDNEITTLQPLAGLTSLMELYCGNNRVAEIKQVLLLRDLPKLIILDLSGNPVCADAEYRGYTLFSLRKLKVLDGLGVDNGEQAQAIAKYTGRLTLEKLEERTGRTAFDGVKSLDLSDAKLRDCGAVFSGASFAALTELDLDSNGLSDVSGLRCLPRLVVLRLTNNKIDDRPLAEGAPPTANGPEGSPGDIFASLEVLHLAGNAITSIAALKLHRFAKLTMVMLQDNEIVKIDGLDKLSRLEKLVLDRNKIKGADGPSFADTVRLRELRLEENALRSLAHFGPLRGLRHLYLGGNRIAELPELDRLAGLSGLSKLNLVNNQITRRQLYRATAIARLPTLQTLDGVRVSDEEREQAAETFSGLADGIPAEPSTMPALVGGPVNKVSLKVNTMQLEFQGPTGPLQPQSAGRAQDATRVYDVIKGFEALRPPDLAPKPEVSARVKADVRRASSLPLAAVRKVEIGYNNRLGTPLGRSSVDDFARLINGNDSERLGIAPGLKKRVEIPVRRASEFPGRMLVVRPLSRDKARPPRMSTGTPTREPPAKKDTSGFGTFPKGLSLKDYYTR